MKIMTDKQFREEMEKALWERDRSRDIGEHFDRLEKRMWQLEDRLRRLENVGDAPVNNYEIKIGDDPEWLNRSTSTPIR